MHVCVWLLKQLNTSCRKAAILDAHKYYNVLSNKKNEAGEACFPLAAGVM